jgi:hypothetical protein
VNSSNHGWRLSSPRSLRGSNRCEIAMAAENRVTQQKLTSRQEGPSSPFSPKEAIRFLDTTVAKLFLLVELREIPEFSEEWRQAKQIPQMVIEAIMPELEEICANLSPEARGALLSLGEAAYGLYDKDTQDEAQLAATKLKPLEDAIIEGIKADYLSRLEALVEPLGVPGLVDYMRIMDCREWGLTQVSQGPVAGPLRDLVESSVFKAFTDLSPIEALSQTRPAIKRRITRKISPVTQHIKRYDLVQRIRLWVRNVVYGESIKDIASRLQADLQRVEDKGYNRDQWIKKQIRDTSRILGFKRPPGRPRKGGVLRQWK